VRLRQDVWTIDTVFSDIRAVAGKWVAPARKDIIWSIWMALLPQANKCQYY